MSFKIRLEKIIKQYSNNPKQFGETLGYGPNPAKLYRLMQDENKRPSVKIIQDIIKAFPHVNARWLLTGEEDMLVEESKFQYGFCKECLKKEGEISRLEKECAAKDKRIEELLLKCKDILDDETKGKKVS
jgi:hypothetical protein